MKTFRTMLKTELKLSLRGMDMFIFAICVPVVVLVIMGIIYGGKPAYEGAEYTFLEQAFGAVTTISICAGGVMGLPLVVSDYRSKKILKRYKVTPVSPVMILFVQVVIYTLYAAVSFLLLYLTAALFFGYQFRGSAFDFLAGYLLVLVSMFSIGMMVGGIAPNTKTAGCDRKYPVFPHADLFRCDTSLRDHACGHAEGGKYFASDTGDKITESCFPGAKYGKCDGFCHHYDRDRRTLYRDSFSIL